MGSPKSLSADQQEELEKAGQLQLLSSPDWTSVMNGNLHLQFALPRQGLSLLRVSW
jgi:xylan 1,4-beta-xylosidase